MKTYLIDDDIICNYITEHILQSEGFTGSIRSFQSADEALNFIKEGFPSNVPDIIFLDLNMPLTSGWDFLDALEPYKQKLQGKCRIYILTSSVDLSDTAKSKGYDLVFGFLQKPIDRDNIRVIKSEVSDKL